MDKEREDGPVISTELFCERVKKKTSLLSAWCVGNAAGQHSILFPILPLTFDSACSSMRLV